MLRDEGSALDLMLRGFDRAMVLDRTGIDIGYNGRRLRGQVAGIDRTAYKIEHVRRRVDTSAVDRALTLVEEGRPREDVLAGLGLAGPDSITLAKLFDGLGLGDRFAAARAVGRRKTLQEGMVAAHGVANAFQLPEVQRRSAQVRTKRYGAPYTLAAGSSLAAGARAMMRTGATVRDDLVESVRSRLVQRYGATDVMVDAGGDARYPFGCTLRVVSHDVFVEVIDRGALSQDRREAAARAGIDLVVLRRCAKGQDADLWFALGCPVGRDWERDHSWIGDRVFDSLRVELSWPRVLTGSVGISRKAARAANAGVFYARELALWERDPMTPKGSVRGRLLCNRHHYLGKLPDQLSDLELLRGMRVSGLVDGYTAFDNSGMVAVLQQYRPSSVYDPCAGWGSGWRPVPVWGSATSVSTSTRR